MCTLLSNQLNAIASYSFGIVHIFLSFDLFVYFMRVYLLITSSLKQLMLKSQHS